MSNLRNLKTDLKSLKYSKDRPDLGYSGQPFLQKDIDKEPTNNSTEDFLLRGGLNAIPTAGEDVARLTKYFFNLKSPSGFLFIAKQNLLSKTSVKTQASEGLGYGGFSIDIGGNTIGPGQSGPINQGVYTPLSTLIQAGTGFLGVHVNALGVNPLSPINSNGIQIPDIGGGLNTYEKSIGRGDNNRLLFLQQSQAQEGYKPTKGDISYNPLGDGNTLLSYQGGPGAILGIGTTNIKKASNPVGINLTPPQTQSPDRANTSNVFSGNTPAWNYQQISSLSTIFDKPEGYNDFQFSTGFSKAETQIRDFRVPLLASEDVVVSTVTGIAPSYSGKNSKSIEGISTSRIKQISPGQKGNVINYQNGKILPDGKVSVVDQINYQPIYKSKGVRSTKSGIAKNDFVKFRIGAIMRDGQKVYTHFRAFIDSFSDNYSSKWNSINYMGRGEEFYKYGGFSRGISLSFTVAAQSKPELMAQYKKLNFLTSTLAPDYGSSGFMGGVLHQLTLGGWCYELPGFISKIGLGVPQESPWEIAIPATDNGGINDDGIFSDSSVKEMPHIVKVSMDFTPIHKFRPELQDNSYTENFGEVSSYGPQRYIQLENGLGDNYQVISLADAQTPPNEPAEQFNL
jgi:hypothetical protein